MEVGVVFKADSLRAKMMTNVKDEFEARKKSRIMYETCRDKYVGKTGYTFEK